MDDSRKGWSPVFADINNDGALDLLVTNGGWQGANQSCVLYQNSGNTNHWLHIRLVGTESNRDGIGARIRVNAGPLSMMREVSGGSGWGHQDALVAEFGLRDQVQADEIEILWPSGQIQRLANIPGDQVVTITQGRAMTVQPKGKQITTFGKVKSQLYQNYPNPFNPETWIPYQLAEDTDLVIRIYSMSGQLVRALSLGHKPAGFYIDRAKAAYWDGKNEASEQVASGIYFYTIQASQFTATRKMVVAKVGWGWCATRKVVESISLCDLSCYLHETRAQSMAVYPPMAFGDTFHLKLYTVPENSTLRHQPGGHLESLRHRDLK